MITKFILDNIFLVIVAFVSGAMLVWPLVRRGAGGPYATPAEATLLINRQDAAIVDVREAAEYATSHIINSRNIPLAQLKGRAAELDKQKDKPLIVVCETGQRSSGAIAILKQAGFTNLFNLQGGIGAWKQAGLPTAGK
jgi:rhodanese-related sulfurtransferase